MSGSARILAVLRGRSQALANRWNQRRMLEITGFSTGFERRGIAPRDRRLWFPPMRTAAEQELFSVLRERSFRFGDFTLASGDRSSYYVDGRMTAVFSRGARLIGEVLYERTNDLPIQAIGGMQVGAVPLTAAAVIAYDLHG